MDNNRWGNRLCTISAMVSGTVMGKVKDWLMQVEEDASCMKLKEFLKVHPNEKDIWNSVNNAPDREPDPSDLEPSQEEIDKHYPTKKQMNDGIPILSAEESKEIIDTEDDDKLMKGVLNA
mgnify:CR=1 FL=1